ncbi:MAG: MOP flippase family protein [Candidatus Omnitrophota bacterium]
MSSLRRKTISGLGWLSLSQMGKQAIQLIITAILARLLSPKDFGLISMIMVFANFVMIFSEMGISSALIQKQDTHDRHYYSVFWLNVIVGIALTILFMAVSPLIAWFYNKPELKVILVVISINYFIASFVIIQQTILTKEMDFRSLAIRDIIAIVLSGGVSIYMAFHGFGVWSLVAQSLTFTLFNAIILWKLSSWRPKCQFNMADIKDIFSFSANLTGFNFINYFSRNIDQLLIGKLLGAQALGYYSLAYKLMLYPLQNTSWIISKVMFPAFSKIQGNLEKVRVTYFKTVKAGALVAFPLMIGLFIMVPFLVTAIFGHKWMAAIGTIRILCVCGLFQSVGTTVGIIYLSMGRADLQYKLQYFGTALVVISVLCGLTWGINGVALFYTLQSLLWVNVNIGIVSRLAGFRFKSFYSNLKIPLIIALGTITPLFLISQVFSFSPIPQIVVLVSCWIVFYLGMLFVTKEVAFKSRVPILSIITE